MVPEREAGEIAAKTRSGCSSVQARPVTERTPVTERRGHLPGVRVLVTRPESAAGRLADALAAEGAEAIRVPAIAIAPVEDTASFHRLRERLEEVAAAVFTSVNAVEGFRALMSGAMPGAMHEALPPVVLAVGPASARALHAQGVAGVHVPRDRFDSEGLLACPQLDRRRIGGRLVAIVKGEGGRDLLACELGRRGAETIEAAVYRRCVPERLAETLDGVRDSVDVVTVTSAEALEHLLGAAPWAASWLSRRPLVVASERVAAIARARRLSCIAVAAGADPASIVEATVRAVVGSAGCDTAAGATATRHRGRVEPPSATGSRGSAAPMPGVRSRHGGSASR